MLTTENKDTNVKNKTLKTDVSQAVSRRFARP